MSSVLLYRRAHIFQTLQSAALRVMWPVAYRTTSLIFLVSRVLSVVCVASVLSLMAANIYECFWHTPLLNPAAMGAKVETYFSNNRWSKNVRMYCK